MGSQDSAVAAQSASHAAQSERCGSGYAAATRSRSTTTAQNTHRQKLLEHTELAKPAEMPCLQWNTPTKANTAVQHLAEANALTAPTPPATTVLGLWQNQARIAAQHGLRMPVAM